MSELLLTCFACLKVTQHRQQQGCFGGLWHAALASSMGLLIKILSLNQCSNNPPARRMFGNQGENNVTLDVSS